MIYYCFTVPVTTGTGGKRPGRVSPSSGGRALRASCPRHPKMLLPPSTACLCLRLGFSSPCWKGRIPNEARCKRVLIPVAGAQTDLKFEGESALPSAISWAALQLAVCRALCATMVTQPGLCVRCNPIIAGIVHKRAEPPWV